MAPKHDDSPAGLREHPEISAELGKIAKEHRWPAELTRRIAELRVPISSLNSWAWFGLSPDQAAAQLGWHERLTMGDLRGRDATYADNEAFSDLWSDSPEEIGEWEITVERGPTPSPSSSFRKTSTFRCWRSATN